MSRARYLGVSIALLVVAFSSAPAYAGQVTVVDGDRVRQVDDPFTPSRAEIDLGPAPGGTRVPARAAGPLRAHAAQRGVRAVLRALSRARLGGAITAGSQASYRRAYAKARSSWRRLAPARKVELGYVLRSVERLASAGRLTPSRMPAVFLQLRRNTSYWGSRPFPASGDQVTFRGSELLFQYFPGRGLQLHPLSNFKKANLLHGACNRGARSTRPVCGARPPGPRRGTPCRPGRLRLLLDELSALAVRRGPGFVAWEYLFHFGGGSPPWMSGMAQSTAIVALGRGAQLLGRPDYHATAQMALGAFEASAPVGVRALGPRGGAHYLQYSFSRRLYIFNAFLQALIGLHDYGRLARDARATGLFRAGEPEALREVPLSDVGDWSRYSYRGRESTREYHELLREMLQGMGRRLGLTSVYCSYAIRYRGYQTSPPVIRFSGPQSAAARRTSRLRFTLSKLSIVEVKVLKGRKLAFRRLGTFRRGTRSFAWKPRSAGHYTVRLGAKELRTGRSRRGRGSGALTVSR
jgi:hypothetical protein